MIKLISDIFALLKETDAQLYNLTSGVFLPNKVNILKRTVDQLLGIPYADIPLPFQKSIEFSRRPNSTRQADKWSPWCYQPFIFHNSFYGNLRIPHDYDMSLNCLSINLYLPADVERKNLSVIFYIHGGSNAAGGSSFIDGSALASIGNVIVAVPNYRLDVLGFFNKLSLNSKSKYNGNYGLWDQITALKWLHKNCDNLGCDKNSIVALGHSAGAANSLILALSHHSQKYIKRIIMQSGSALSHWSYSYDQYVLEKVKTFGTEYKSILNSLNFKNYKSIRSVEDTLINFISITTCNLTRKYNCFKEKIKNVTKLIETKIFKEKKEQKILKYFHKLFTKLDFYQLLNVFGYFHKILFEKKDFKFVQNFYNQNDLTEIYFNSSNFSDQLYQELMDRNNQNFHSEIKNTGKKSTCHMNLALLIPNSEIVSDVCEIFDSYNDSYDIIFNSKLIRYILNCFSFYYNKSSDSDLLDSLVVLNVQGTLTELELCIDQGTFLTQKLITDGQIDDAANFTLNYTQKEYCFLTKNSNFLYKPSTDGQIIKSWPHDQLVNDEYFNSNIDVLIGVTTTESFYFLLHSYDMNEIIKHAFIHSSMINRTDNLIEKLILINRKNDLNLCLKRSLVNFYKISMSDEELENNSLKGKLDALELMSDFDFRLSVITQLKIYLDNQSSNKVYAYLYSHLSSVNYLLDHLKSYYEEYQKALKKLNNSVTPHFSELDFVFGLPVLSQETLLPKKSGQEYNYTQEEFDFSLKLIEYWTNFAKIG